MADLIKERRSLDDIPSDSWFVVIHDPRWPMVMTEETDDPSNPRIALFDTFDEAEEAIARNAAARTYGAEVFQLENGEWSCPTR